MLETATTISRIIQLADRIQDDIRQRRLEPGDAYTGTAANGGPGNGAGANDLQNAGSWDRVYPERKQIKFARMVTREA